MGRLVRWLGAGCGLVASLCLITVLCACSAPEKSASSQVAAPAAAPSDILTAADLSSVTGDGDLVATPLDLNPDALYQVAFDRSGGERVAIFTVVESTSVETLDPGGASTPVDIGDEGTATDTAVVFRVGNKVGMLATFERQFSDGTRPAIDAEQLKELAAVAASRM